MMAVLNHEVGELKGAKDGDLSFDQSRSSEDEIEEINSILNSRPSDEGRNKKVFDYETDSGHEYKLKLVFNNFSGSNLESVSGLEGVAHTDLLYEEFEQDGIVSKKGPVVVQEASDLDYAGAMHAKGWEETLRETVRIQEKVIEESFEKNGRKAILYDFRPSNIHFFEDEEGGYEPGFVDVADSGAVKEPGNRQMFRRNLAAAYDFLVNGKESQRGLIKYGEDNSIDIDRDEAVEVIADESNYIEEGFEPEEDLRGALESAIMSQPNRYLNYSQ